MQTIGTFNDPDPSTLFEQELYNEGVTCYNAHLSGYVENIHELAEQLKKFIGEHKTIYKRVSPTTLGYTWKTADCLLTIPTRSLKDKYFNVVLNTRYEEQANKFLLKFKDKFCKKPSKGKIHVLSTTPSGYELAPLGTIDEQFVPSNYNPDVVKKYEHITKCLESSSPCGRFVLMTGAPGTGKSYMIRALVTNINAIFVLIPSTLIGNISNPEILTTLTKFKNDIEEDEEFAFSTGIADADEERKVEKCPIVLILEDADIALEDRKTKGNSGSISEILNFGDGLFGELANFRIIATSNLERIQLDDAIKRPGRMCKYIEIPELEKAKASEVFHRLTGKTRKFTEPTSLAMVYRLARDEDWEPDDKKAVMESGQYV